jgi:hypothetical protein
MRQISSPLSTCEDQQKKKKNTRIHVKPFILNIIVSKLYCLENMNISVRSLSSRLPSGLVIRSIFANFLLKITA